MLIAEIEVMQDAEKSHAGFFFAGNDLDLEAGFIFHALEKYVAVFGFAHGTGGDGLNFFSAKTTRYVRHALQGSNRALHGRRRQVAAPRHALPDAGGFLFIIEHAKIALAVDFDYDRTGRIGADIDGSKTPRFHALR